MNELSKVRVDKFNNLFWLSDPILASWIVYHLSPKGNTICEIGAGTGNMLNYYKDIFTKIVLIEPNEFMIENLLKKQLELNIEIKKEYAEKISLKDKSVDIAFSKSSLHHYNNINQGLREMTRIAVNAISIVEVIAPTQNCIPFLEKVVIRKERKRSVNSIFTETMLMDYIKPYVKNCRILHFDQYIDIVTWLESGDLNNDEQEEIVKYIVAQEGSIKKEMQIHFRNGRLSMLRRMALVIGELS